MSIRFARTASAALTVLNDYDIDMLDDLVAALDDAIATGEQPPSPEAAFTAGYYRVDTYVRRGLMISVDPAHHLIFALGRP